MPRPGIPVGWNWKNSMSCSGTPRRYARATPSPVRECAFEVVRNMRPKPPVANITAVGREAGPTDRALPEVAGVTTEPPLIDAAVGRAVEGQPHVLQLDHRVDGLARQDLSGVLVHEVVATLDGVEHVPLPMVLLEVAESGTDAALC